MAGTPNPLDEVVAAAAIGAMPDLSPVDGAAPKRVKLLPIGTIEMRDGRGPYRIRDKLHAQQVVAATKLFLGSADFSFDYDHQMLHAVKPGVGGKAAASGWAKSDTLVADDDGIYAEAEWTPAAAKAIGEREYRYLSPLFMASKPADGGDVLYLKNAALVNIGAIDLPAIAAGLSGDDQPMTFALIAAAAGLAATATEADIVTAIETIKAKADAAPSTSAIAIAAGLADTATVDEIAASVTTLKTASEPDPAKYVPIDQVSGITNQLATLNDERAEREVAAAIQSGKLAPSMKPWGLKLFKTDEPAWKDYVTTAPQIVAAGAELDDRQSGKAFTSLTADEVAACGVLGVEEAEFLRRKNEEVA